MVIFKFTNKRIRFLIDEIGLEKTDTVKTFEQRVSKFLTEIVDLPNEFTLKSTPLKEWYILSLTESEEASLKLQEEMNSFIDFIWTITSFKSYRLIQTILDKLNTDDFYTSSILLRSLLETNCICYNTLTKLSNEVRYLNAWKDDVQWYSFYHSNIEQIINKFYRPTRREDILENIADATLSKSIVTEINEVSKIDNYVTLRDKYSVLCEIAHPNLTSNDIFGFMPESVEVTKKEKNMHFAQGTISRFYRIFPESEPHLPYQFAFFGLIIQVLDLCMNLCDESINIGRHTKTKALTVSWPQAELFDQLWESKQKEIIEYIWHAEGDYRKWEKRVFEMLGAHEQLLKNLRAIGWVS
jgi:hypothetical protein